MMTIAPDRRRLAAEPDLAAHERAVNWAAGFLEHRLGLARELRRIAETNTFLHFDCGTIEEYGLRLGLKWSETRQLVELGHALDAPVPAKASEPDAPSRTLEQAIRQGAIALENAALAGRVLAKPELQKPGEDPVKTAIETSTTRMRDLVRRREEEVAQKEPVSPLHLFVTARAKDAFARARTVASERAGATLTEGETLALVTSSYLDLHDPMRQPEGARRLSDTADLPDQRAVPAEVKRTVRRRAGNRCEVPGCPHESFLEFAHIESHRNGGSREALNLVLACGRHHVLLDAGRIRFAGWVDGLPSFADSQGEILGEGATLIAGSTCAGEDLCGVEPCVGPAAERPPPK